MSVIAAPGRSHAPAPLLSPAPAPAAADRAPAERNGRAAKGALVALSSRVYLPACSIAAVAAVLVGIGWSNRWGGADFVGAMTSLRVVVIGPLTLAVIGLFLIVERLRPAQRRPIFARGYRQDLLYTRAQRDTRRAAGRRADSVFLGGGPQVPPVDRLGEDRTRCPGGGRSPLSSWQWTGCNWFAHLANHRVRVLWRFHELHHSQEDMSVLTVFRTHPLIHVSYLIALIPGIVLLANGALSTTLLVIYGVIVAFAHSNTNLGFGPLERIVRQSELPPDPPQVGRTTGRQPRLRPDDLGSALPSSGVPDGRDDPDRHRAAGSTVGRRTGDASDRAISRSSPRSSWRRSVRCTTARISRPFGRQSCLICGTRRCRGPSYAWLAQARRSSKNPRWPE